MAKRYVLFQADSDLTAEDRKTLARFLEQRHGKVLVIEVRGNERAAIVKTTNVVARSMRDDDSPIDLGGKRLRTILVSGAIGNLKRRAGGEGTR